MKKKYDRTKCWDCGGRRIEKIDTDTDGVTYRYWECEKCGEKVLDMEQLHEAAEEYKKLRKLPSVRISKWGSATALRIPKTIIQRQRIKVGETALIIPEKVGFKVVPEKHRVK